MEGSEMTRIPSDDEFARAKRLMEEDSRNLSQVSKNAKQRFKNLCPLHNIYILPQIDVNFRAYVFFNNDKDVETCKDNGITQQLIDFIYSDLERAGRGKKGEITVAFEFDSDENVSKNFEGDYFLRLR